MSELFGDRSEVLGVCEQALAACPADEVMVHLYGGANALTRFANNHIHQNVAEQSAHLSVRAFLGARSGIATTTDVSEVGIRDAARRALELARQAQAEEEYLPLPAPMPIEHTSEAVPATAACGPEERAAAVRTIIHVARQAGQIASGAFAVGTGWRAVATSAGVRACEQIASAHLRTVIMARDSSGFAAAVSRDVRDIDPQQLAHIASEKASACADPRTVNPGSWDVILEPEAVGTIVELTARLTFGALAYQEGRSAICGRLNQQVCGTNITLWDDALDPRGMMSCFDYEGMPRRPVTLIAQGVARGLLYDTKTAARDGVTTTGHATGPGGWGPMPAALFLQPGTATLQDMIAATQRGLLVTRFHYTNVLSPKQTVLTGMTRDGTFLIEGGQVVAGVRNLRFTENILQALGRVETIGAQGKLVGGVWVPALKIRDFTFTGLTDF